MRHKNPADIARLKKWQEANPDKVEAYRVRRLENRRRNPTLRNKRLEEWRRRNARRKGRAIDAYGGKCACCGEIRLEFLTIDHTDGKGSVHRKQLGIRGYGGKFYQWLAQNGWPEGFRVLCFNCNGSLGCYGYCPHGGVDVQQNNNSTRSTVWERSKGGYFGCYMQERGC